MRVNVTGHTSRKIFKTFTTEDPEVFMNLDYIKLGDRSSDLLRIQKRYVEFNGSEPTLVLGVIK